MCEWGNKTNVNVKIPADLAANGIGGWAVKPVDSCIAKLVESLNQVGMFTRSSCCGHGERVGSIPLHDGRVITLGLEENMSYWIEREDGTRIEGPFTTSDDAMMARVWVEKVMRPETFWVRGEPKVGFSLVPAEGLEEQQ